MNNVSIGGNSYDVSDDVKAKVEELLNGDDCIEVESLDELIGKKLAFQCARYIYFGKIKKVNSLFIELEDAQLVFDTGDFSNKKPEDAQDLPKKKAYLMRQSIEVVFPTNWS
jgi:hypothetical protein